MTDIALRPRSATEIVDAAFQVYRREPLQFMLGLGLIYVPWLALASVFAVDLTGPVGAAGGASLLFAPLAILVYALASGVTISIANDVYFGRAADVRAAFRRTARKLWPLVATAFAVGVLIGVAALVMFAVASPLGPLARGALSFLAAGIFAVYVGVRFFGARAVVMVEDTGADAGLRRSWRLTRGQYLHTFGTVVLAVIILMVVLVGEVWIAQMIPSRVVQAALGALVSIVVMPVFSITETLLYYDLRIRNEGFDVEYLASTMPVPEQAGS